MPEDIFYEIKLLFSRFFYLPTDWFVWPKILLYFSIPLIGLILMWYTFLDKKLRIFRKSVINLVLSVIIAVFSSPLIAVFTPAVVLTLSLGVTALLRGRFTFWRILGSILVAIITFYLFSFLVRIII